MLKKISKIGMWIFGILLLILFILYALLQTSFFQTFITQKIASYLGGELNTEISVGGVDIEWFHTLVLEDVYIEDQAHNELLQLKALKLSGFEKLEDRINVSNLTLVEPHFHLMKYADSTVSNMQFIIDYFKPAQRDTNVIAPVITSNHVNIQNGVFEYENYRTLQASSSPIDYNSLYLTGINLDVVDFYNKGDSLYTQINYINFNEKSGLHLKDLQGVFSMNDSNMDLLDASIETNNSLVFGDFNVRYSSWNDFSKFNKKVKLEALIDESEVELNDLAFFSNELKGIKQKIKIKGEVKGRVSNLKAKDLVLQLDEKTSFKGNLSINGLPNFKESFITLDVDELQTNYAELSRIQIPPFVQDQTLSLPNNFKRLGQIKFKGNFTGFIFDFAAYGDLSTRLGTLVSDISLNQKENGSYAYNGNLKTNGFHVGKFYDLPDVGSVASNINVKGSGIQLADIKAKVKGKINSFEFRQYTYKEIDIDGDFRNKYFNGDLKIYDDNLWMDFSGEVDLNKKLPQFGFVAEVQNIDFVDLNFFPDEKYAALSGKITANAMGSNLDNIVGDIEFEDLTYCFSEDECRLENLKLHSELNKGVRKIVTESSVLTGTLEGEYNFKDLPHSLELILESIIPSYEVEHEEEHTLQDFELNVRINDFYVVQKFLKDDYYVSPDTRVFMKVDERANDFELNSTADSIVIKGVKSEGITLDTRRADSTLFFTLLSDIIHLNEQVSLQNFSLDGRSELDTLYTSLEWDSPDEYHYGQLSGRYLIRGSKNIDYFFDRSLISVKNSIWDFNRYASINIDSTRIHVNDFNISRGDEYIAIDGVISEASRSKLNVDLRSINLNNINPWISEMGTEFQGVVDGSLTLQDVYDERLIFSDLNVTNLEIDQYEIGNIHLDSKWENEERRIKTKGSLMDGVLNPIAFEGYYSPKDKESPLDLTAKVTDFNLEFLNSFIKEAISNIGGFVSGDLTLSGKVEEPILGGELEFKNAQLKVDYLNTVYTFQDKVKIDYDIFQMDYIRVFDQEGNIAHVNGGIMHENFNNWNFDIFADLESKVNKFLCLNTTEEMNNLYYGKAYARGYVSVSGFANNLDLEITMKTRPGTEIAMPMGSSSEIAFEDFVTFVDRNAPIKQEEGVDLSGIRMNFELDINENAEFEIIFDEAIGDVMRGRGNGRINMNIDTRGTFEMFGQVDVTEGDYKFVLKNLINKDFTVIPGGTISWFGDPLGAILELKAVYHLSAPLYDLLGDIESSYKNRTAVDLIMDLNGDLLSPGISFDIVTPNVDEITKSRVASAINSEEEKNRQAFALIALRRFISPPNISIAHSNSILTENGSELLSSQLSNWLSQISNEFDLGINYRPGDEITNQEIAVALSTQFFNDRLSISGNFGVSSGNEANQNPNSLIGDIRVEYVVDETGKIRLVMYNRSNDFDIASTSQNASTQGAGVIYREEFDSMEEFYCSFKNLFRKDDNRVPCE